MDIRGLTALEIGQLIRERKISSPEVTRIFLDASKRDFDKSQDDTTKINAYIELLEENALSAAGAVQARIDTGEFLSPVAGVPMALKDCICTKDGHTTAASKMLENFRAPYDAAACERLREAGAVLIGKANMDEFAMGTSNETSYFGAVRNPWDLSRVPGGSSGGCAAAVSAGLAPFAIGTDAGGSLRQPCSFCNLTGIKPTYGSVSHYGVLTGASSLDQIGPMARDARDCAVILSILSGPDPRDGASALKEPFNFCDVIHGEKGGSADALAGRKIGLPLNYLAMRGLDADVKAHILKAAETMSRLGAKIVEFELPFIEYAMPAYLAIFCAEASSGLARFDGIRYGYRSAEAVTANDIYYKSRSQGFGDEVKRRILLGSLALSSGYYDRYFRKALKARSLIKGVFDKALTDLDLILAPVCGTTAFESGGRIKDTQAMYAGDTFTASANLAGLPAAAAPCGFGADGLPVGMQLIGRAFEEGLILDTIARFQQVTDHHKKRPEIIAQDFSSEIAREGGKK